MLNDQVVVITGASRGLGAGFAKRLAADGANVVLAARNEELLRQVANEIEADGGTALPVRCDVTVQKDIDELVRATLDRFGRVDVLVNNAGALVLAPFLEETDEMWYEMLEANLTSARRATKAFLPTMLEQGAGRIIFVSSNAAKKGFPHDAAYSVAKAGLMALAKVLAVEYGTKGIDVHAVCPGLVAETDLGEFVVVDHIQNFEGSREKFWEWANPLSPKGFHPTLDEIVDLVAFLASGSPGSAVLHGTVLTADHGMTPY
jgi:NAD(P)-dependent dehydrogenase (short-subunit alcohol dehydrogenase family)